MSLWGPFLSLVPSIFSSSPFLGVSVLSSELGSGLFWIAISLGAGCTRMKGTRVTAIQTCGA